VQPLSHIRTRRPLAAAAAACALGALIVGCGGSSNSGGESSKAAEPRATSGASSLTSTTEPKSGAPAPGTPVQGATVPVAYRNIAISPAKLRVKVGATVVWTNYDSVEHNVTSEGGPQKLAVVNLRHPPAPPQRFRRTRE